MKSTIKRWELINHLTAKKKPCTYLEIGCRSDKCFNKINAKHKYGVDPQSGGTHRATSDEFFKDNTMMFDVVFIDGLHLHEQVNKDIENSLQYLNDDGFIVLHDMLPINEQDQIEEYDGKSKWNGTVWKSAFDLLRRDDVELMIGDFDEGCGVVQKRPNTNQIMLEGNLDWDFYVKNKKLLPVYTYDKLIERIDEA